jgi:hypothetical protein
MIFSARSVTVFFTDDDEPETFELPPEDVEEWELRFAFEPGWVIVYFFDTSTNKPGVTWAFPSQKVSEVTSEQEGDAKKGDAVPEEPKPEGQ